MLSKDELERIEALDKARTQGEWETRSLEGKGYSRWMEQLGKCIDLSIEYGNADPEFHGVTVDVGEASAIVGFTGNGPTSKANAEFLAACSTAVPALLRHIEELTAERDRLREALELAEGYLVERGIEHKGTVGRTIVLPAIRAALGKEAQGE